MYTAVTFLFASVVANDPAVSVTQGMTTDPLSGVPADIGQPYGDTAVVKELPDFLQGSTYFNVPPFPSGGAFTFTCPATSMVSSQSQCETSFARLPNPSDRQCFIDLGFSRWGWTNVITDSITMPVYSAAGQCDIGKGYLSAYLQVDYLVGQGIRLTFLPEPGFTVTEMHLYIGKNIVPLTTHGKKVVETVAPGQFPVLFEDGTKTYTFDIPNLAVGDAYYMVAHAVICGAPVDSCPCTFYLTSVQCTPCSTGIDGGLAQATSHDGWAVRGTGPLINMNGGSGFDFRTRVFRKEVSEGSEDTVQTKADAVLTGVYAFGCGAGASWAPLPVRPAGPSAYSCPCDELPGPLI